jgi:hypothetical protein
MRRLFGIWKFVGVALISLTMGLAAVPALATPITVSIDLLPSLEIPEAISETTGTANITYDPADPEAGISYVVSLYNLGTALLAAHIHSAPSNANGPIIAQLFSICPIGQNGCDGLMRITGGEVILAGMVALQTSSWAAVIADIEAGNAYINVHTEGNPSGDVRGNFVPEPSTAFLLGIGLIGLAIRQSRWRQNADS